MNIAEQCGNPLAEGCYVPYEEKLYVKPFSTYYQTEWIVYHEVAHKAFNYTITGEDWQIFGENCEVMADSFAVYIFYHTKGYRQMYNQQLTDRQDEYWQKRCDEKCIKEVVDGWNYLKVNKILTNNYD